MSKAVRLYPVILSGGSGSRLWPLSREEFPKQLQPLTSERSLLQDTALRLDQARRGNFQLQAPIVVCNNAHRFVVAEQLRAVGIEPKAIIVEPEGRNTAPAACVAALLLEGEPDALMLVMPSDHLVRMPEAFFEAVTKAVPVAQSGRLVAFGIRPTAPATAYGYIKQGETLEGAAHAVARFVEKPNAATAADFVKSGDYFWNGGIFLWPVGLYLNELASGEPQIPPACRIALSQGQNDLFFFRLDAAAFAKVPVQSIDYGVMERTKKAAVVAVDMGWSDVGSWSALHDEAVRDAAGNTILGDVVALDTHNSYVRTDKQLTAVIGIKNAIVVVTADAVLVADKAHDQQVKQIVERLKAAGRTEATAQARTHRPWGWFQTMDEGHRFKVKRLCVKPGAKLSLQKHWHRSEHWIVVTGLALVTRGDDDFTLRENESTYIAAGTLHRLANPGQSELHMIEVQSGEYVGEDDIVRIADDYGRSAESDARSGSRPRPKAKARKVTAKNLTGKNLAGKKRRRKLRRKADPAAARRRRVSRHPVRPSTKVTTKLRTKRPSPKRPPPKPPRKRR
ncbi:MAG: mannose-1-phosphate guanylyltransferase/mannose-6-phosphate isomerase [Rhodospirillaceae bacterium]|nr:mannose-1-phosphate guanylyltransferase/mannose-6-phosphate isomerase [Rhodospirillaceae bacterium]